MARGLLLGPALAAAAAAAPTLQGLNDQIFDLRQQRVRRQVQCMELEEHLSHAVQGRVEERATEDSIVGNVGMKVTKASGQVQQLVTYLEDLGTRLNETKKLCKRGVDAGATADRRISNATTGWTETMQPLSTTPRLRARYSRLKSTYKDQASRLDGALKRRANFCSAQVKAIEDDENTTKSTLKTATAHLKEVEKELAAAQKAQFVAQKVQAIAEKTKSTMLSACKKNATDSDALEKKLMLQRGKIASGTISDCTVTAFVPDGPCNATCGGGVRKLMRTIIQKNGPRGVECPDLEVMVKCNQQKCPQDCKMGNWSAWGNCSATCGGGLRKRTRKVVQKEKGRGKPCGHLLEYDACNQARCHENCQLGEWGPWGFCTKGCGKGQRGRTRGVKAPPKGLGLCPSASSPKRVQFADCPAQACPPAPGSSEAEAFKMMAAMGSGAPSPALPGAAPPPQGTLECVAKMDFVIAVDASPVLTPEEFKEETEFAADLISRLLPASTSGDGSQVGLVFLSPGAQGNSPASAWTSPLSKDAAALKAWLKAKSQGVGAPSTPEGITAAGGLLKGGRPGVPSTVIMLLRGKPETVRESKVLTKKLQDQGTRVVVMATYPAAGIAGAPAVLGLLASPPVAENVVVAESFLVLWKGLRQRVASVCPVLQGVPAGGSLPSSYLPKPPS